MMIKFSKIAVLGLMALLLSGNALANGPGVYGGYPGSSWSGGVTVYGDSRGYTGYSGTINVGGGYATAPVYMPAYAPAYVPVYVPAYVPVAAPRYGPRGHYRKHHRNHGHGRCRGHGKGCRY